MIISVSVVHIILYIYKIKEMENLFFPCDENS